MLNRLLQPTRLLAITKEEREFHRKTAVKCFNRAWDYLLMASRSAEDSKAMLHLAHASRYHWGIVGTPRNLAVGDWQLARVYSALGNSELSPEFALSSLKGCESEHWDDLVPSAMEALARAYATGGDFRNAEKLLKMARKKLDRLVIEKEDREIYASQIRETESFLKRKAT